MQRAQICYSVDALLGYFVQLILRILHVCATYVDVCAAHLNIKQIMWIHEITFTTFVLHRVIVQEPFVILLYLYYMDSCSYIIFMENLRGPKVK